MQAAAAAFWVLGLPHAWVSTRHAHNKPSSPPALGSVSVAFRVQPFGPFGRKCEEGHMSTTTHCAKEEETVCDSQSAKFQHCHKQVRFRLRCLFPQHVRNSSCKFGSKHKIAILRFVHDLCYYNVQLGLKVINK